MTSNEDLVSYKIEQYFYTLLHKLGLKYSSVTICNNFEKSKNIVCTIAKVLVTVEENENKEHSFIIKSTPQDKGFKEFIHSSTLFDRELYVYTNVLHQYEIFQNEKNVLNAQFYAKFFGSTSEETHDAIIMQDMTADGYKILNVTKPIDYEHAMLVMKEYGKLHALSYALRDQKPKTFLDLSNNLQEGYFSGKAWNSLKPLFKITLSRIFKTIDPLKHKTVHRKYSKCLEHLDHNLLRVLKSENAGKYAVIGHGDCWVNNILFKYEDPENPQLPTKLCFIDWQFSRLGSPALDLSYFLFASTDRKTRENHFDNFIQEYHGSVCSFYTELTGNKEICLPFKVLQEHLRKFSIYGLFLSLQALYINLNTLKETIDEKATVLTFESVDMTEYNTRAQDIILDFDKFGYDMY